MVYIAAKAIKRRTGRVPERWITRGGGSGAARRRGDKTPGPKKRKTRLLQQHFAAHTAHRNSNSSLHRATLYAGAIYNRVDAHINACHPRHGLHVRARRLAVCLAVVSVPCRRAAHAARVTVAAVAVGLQAVRRGRRVVRLRADRGGPTVGRAIGVLRTKLVHGRQVHADPAVIVVVCRRQALLHALAARRGAGVALQVLEAVGHALEDPMLVRCPFERV